MCNFGHPVNGDDAHSRLRTNQIEREWRTLPSGHVTFVPAGFPMEWRWNYRSESIHLTMLPKFLSRTGSELNLRDGDGLTLKPLFRIVDQTLSSLLHQLRDEVTKHGLGQDLVTSSLLQLISVQIYRLGETSNMNLLDSRVSARFSDQDLRRSIDFLNDKIDQNVTLADFAAEFNMSPFHFSRVFKCATGFPPHQYQLRLRIARARERLLQRPKPTIAELAFELGFSDESHFRRHFKRIVGVTPSMFLQQQ